MSRFFQAPDGAIIHKIEGSNITTLDITESKFMTMYRMYTWQCSISEIMLIQMDFIEVDAELFAALLDEYLNFIQQIIINEK